MNSVTINGLRVAYQDSGAGPAVLLVHGWPTSSYLWRDVAPAIAARNRVIAVDLPGFGESDKPLDAHYGFGFFDGVLDGLLEALGIDTVGIAVHDLGGPIGLHWALARPERVTGVALLNTLLYPELITSSLEFLTRLSTPGSREELTSPEGLTALFRSGLAHPERASAELLDAVIRAFPDDDSRLALAYAGTQLSRRGLVEIAKGLPGLRVPVRIIYGAQDRLLTDVEETFTRVRADVPHAVVTALPDAGHFLQEDAPDEVGALLAEFFAGLSTEDRLQRT